MPRELVVVVRVLVSKNVIFHWGLIVSLLIISIACTSFPKPKDFIADPQVFHHQMKANAEQIKSLTGELAVEIWQKNKKLHIRQLFATRAPLDLRMDTLSPFEQPIATLVSNQNEVKLYDLEQKKVFQGQNNEANFAKLLQFEISPSALSSIFRGQVPSMIHEGGSVDWDGDENAYVLSLEKDSKKQKIWIHAVSREIFRSEISENGQVIIELRLSNFHPKQKALAQTIRMDLPLEKTVMLIELKEFEVNVEFPDETFQLEVSDRIPVEDLDE
jgi:outer membrane lipoprotein-sorting protein